MNVSIVMTVIGADRAGLVEALAEVVAAHGGNWEESRMAQLAGQFAGLVHVHVDAGRAGELERALASLDGVSVTVARAGDGSPVSDTTRLLRLEIVGNDHPGIVHSLAAAMAARGINVEELETGIEAAAMSGAPMFRARARLQVPEEVSTDEVREDLERLAADLMVDLHLDSATA